MEIFCRRKAVLWVVSQTAPTHCWRGGRRLDPSWAGADDGARSPRGMLEAVLVCAYWDGTSLGCAQRGWDRGGCWLRVLGPLCWWGASSTTASLGYSACRERAAFTADGCGREGERHPRPTGPAQQEPWLLRKASIRKFKPCPVRNRGLCR